MQIGVHIIITTCHLAKNNTFTRPTGLAPVKVMLASRFLDQLDRANHHLFIDVDPSASDSVIPKTAQIIHLGNGASEVTLTPEQLPRGKHRIIAVFAWGDHVPMKGVRADTVTFTVRK